MRQRKPVAFLLGPLPAVVAAARRAGAHPVVVAPDRTVASDREGADRPVRADWRDHAELVRALGERPELREGAAVFGFDAAGALAAARANEALGLPGTPVGAVTALMDKASLRARVNALGGRPVSFVRCGRADLVPFLTHLIGYPCVVKPRAGHGGEGVRRILDPADAVLAASAYPRITDLLVEEFLEGPELTVAALSRGGRHRILGCARRLPSGGAALAAEGYELPYLMAPAVREEVGRLVRAVLDLAGHRDGPSHTELVLTAAGPRLVECHARPGGEELAALLRLAHGTDPYALAVAAGLGLPGPPGRPRAAHAGVRYLDFPAGPVPLAGLAGIRALPGVVRVALRIPPGAVVRHPPTGGRHHAWVLATAPTAFELAATLSRATELLGPRLPRPVGP
ncbi:ATP-grasp domain-containing protein [Streptomyces sp. NPDC089919]|uniref:ATP-grasp domain-containing protein n=1 Tax=Streptomyces sp. NPDC089919 TaxID=3155188 RepID=UPI003412F71B